MNLKLVAFPMQGGKWTGDVGFVVHPVVDKVKEMLMHPDKNPDICREFWDRDNCRFKDTDGKEWYFEIEDQDENDPDIGPYPIVLVSIDPEDSHCLWEEHYIPFNIPELAREYVRAFSHGSTYILLLSNSIQN